MLFWWHQQTAMQTKSIKRFIPTSVEMYSNFRVHTRSEKLIGDAFDNIMENNTSIVIAHRLSTIQKSDIILVLKDGDVIEQGNHDYLMNKKGFYYSMYSSQFK